MAKDAEPKPTGWPAVVVRAIKLMADRDGVSGQELARRIGRSQNYVATRLREEKGWDLADIEALGRALSFDPARFLVSLDKVTLQQLDHDGLPTFDNVLPFPGVRGLDEDRSQPEGVAAGSDRTQADPE